MRKYILLIFLLIGFYNLQAQVISSSRWTDLFSYNNVLAIREGNGKLIAATENGIFYYTPATGELTKLSKTNGLHEVKITAFDYNPETNIGLVGYKNGSMDVITPDGITLVVDIPIATGFGGDKSINHISISGNKAVVSVAYGVSVFNLDKKEFGDTCFFSNGSSYTAARKSIILNNKVYTATSIGLLSHEINTTFPVFSGWTNVKPGDFKQVATNGTQMVYADDWYAFIGDGTNFTSLSTFGSPSKDVTMNQQNVLLVDRGKIRIMSVGGAIVDTRTYQENINTGLMSNNQVFVGSVYSGILNEAGNSIKPDGPYSNISYKLDLYKNQIAVSTGSRDSYNQAIRNGVGYYHFDGLKWNYPEIFKTNLSYDILDAVINRNKPSEIFFTNYSSVNNSETGIYRMEGENVLKQYTGNNNDKAVGLVFDENKQLFASASHMTIGGGEGIGYYYYDAAGDQFIKNPVVISGGVQKPLAHEGVLYIPSPVFVGGGMLIYNYNNTPTNTSDDSFKLLRKENNLPADGTVSAAVDKNGTLWIGTRIGLRTLSDPVGAISEQDPQTDPIIIEQNGLGEELFRNGHILQIAVDPGNQKWVSVEGGGVFYLSSDGQQTLQHFTRANSPLPIDNVTDIKIDEASGKVYFATFDGIVVYQGDVVTTNSNFGDVLVYPNPVVYANYKGNVRIRGLAQKTFIRITDAAGNLVHSATATGGFYEWNLNNQRGVRVASGIYFVLMSNEDGTDTATAKIAVVN